MEKSKTLTTRKLVFTALMAALTVAGSALRITLPLDIAGTTSFHLGNIMCALSGILLGPWLGGLASGLGSAIYDITNPLYLPECWITFLTKGAYGLVAGLVIRAGKKNFGYVKAILATLAGAVTYAALYLAKSYFYSGLLIKGLTPDAALLTVIGKLPATIFNAVVALIFAPILAIAIRKALEENHLTLE
ncbi:MAG: ECF transporter S component [Faecousia sp.]